ncbi:6,7-dimethyl-8-ribityllumazine synthase [Candidatus Peregrinibacteria bacterium]|nr:6,7-dimethyl-8-ribityllumazine synthase [Candidatus Peregrinibacteria bacterium]
MKISHHDTGMPKGVDPNWRIAIIHATYYKEEIAALVESAKTALKEAGIPEKNISLYAAPGSFEIPLIGAALAEAKAADALIGIGIIVQGETKHADLLAESVAHGMMNIQIRYRIPFAFEVLYVDSIAQARARGEKGKEAAHAVLQSLAEIKGIL